MPTANFQTTYQPASVALLPVSIPSTDQPTAKVADSIFEVGERENQKEQVKYLRQPGPGKTFVTAESSETTQLVSIARPADARSFTKPAISDTRSYQVHGELILGVPDFSASAYAKPMPWSESYNSSWNIRLNSYGSFRCFFNNGVKGNYTNFYEMIDSSGAQSFYAKTQIPQYYSDDGNCDETTFCPKTQDCDFEQYRPFVREGRGYTRSYFYGVAI